MNHTSSSVTSCFNSLKKYICIQMYLIFIIMMFVSYEAVFIFHLCALYLIRGQRSTQGRGSKLFSVSLDADYLRVLIKTVTDQFKYCLAIMSSGQSKPNLEDLTDYLEQLSIKNSKQKGTTATYL